MLNVIKFPPYMEWAIEAGIGEREIEKPVAHCWNCGRFVKTDDRGSYSCTACDVRFRPGDGYARSYFIRPHPGFIDHATVYAPSPG